jgi:hypothetical protein
VRRCRDAFGRRLSATSSERKIVDSFVALLALTLPLAVIPIFLLHLPKLGLLSFLIFAGTVKESKNEPKDETTGPKRLYGRCRACSGLGVFFDYKDHEYYYLNRTRHVGHIVDFWPDPSVEDLAPEKTVTDAQFVPSSEDSDLKENLDFEPLKVIQRITPMGYYYRNNDSEGIEVGPSTTQDEDNPEFDLNLARKLKTTPKEIMKARLWQIRRSTTFSEIADVLGSTIRHDLATKLILFCAGVLTFTDEDQTNILMAGESAGGKSYTALEVTAYFPVSAVRIIATASPTAFFHDEGTWDKEQHLLRVDLHQKILVFLDQPHYTLMERLRPLLSHDRRELLYKITDKSKRGALRTKNVVLQGFPTVIFCAAKLSLDEQERTRVFLLSPETDQEKLQESIQLRISRDGDRETFRVLVDAHPLRRWLKTRVRAIQESQIQQVVIEDTEAIYKRFRDLHKRLAPRHQRDISRILALVKAHALLNWAHRERRNKDAILANSEDVEAGFWLYGLVAKANEMGLAPQLYEIWETVLRPLIESSESAGSNGVSRRSIITSYHDIYGRFLSDEKLRREILPALEASGLIIQEPDPADKRQKLICRPTFAENGQGERGGPPNVPPISPLETIGGVSGVHPPSKEAS